MSFMLGGKQTVKKPLSVFINWSHYLPAIIGFGYIHRLLPSLWISACTPYIISLCFIPMHDSYCKQWNWTCRAKKRWALRGNKISWRRPSMVGAKAAPLHPFCIVFKRKLTVLRGFRRRRHSCLTSEVFTLTWHADVGNIRHMVPCIAYFIHQICHLLSLDMLCVNAIYLVSLSYTWIMQCHVV